MASGKRGRPHRVADATGGGGRDRPPASITLVEDNLAVLDATRFLLEGEGFRVIAVTAGGEALGRVMNEAIRSDLIVADHRLPEGESGTEVIQRIRTVANRSIPAIVMTGDTTLELSREVEATGCRLLYKPVDGDEFLSLVRRLIAGDS